VSRKISCQRRALFNLHPFLLRLHQLIRLNLSQRCILPKHFLLYQQEFTPRTSLEGLGLLVTIVEFLPYLIVGADIELKL